MYQFQSTRNSPACTSALGGNLPYSYVGELFLDGKGPILLYLYVFFGSPDLLGPGNPLRAEMIFLAYELFLDLETCIFLLAANGQRCNLALWESEELRCGLSLWCPRLVLIFLVVASGWIAHACEKGNDTSNPQGERRPGHCCRSEHTSRRTIQALYQEYPAPYVDWHMMRCTSLYMAIFDRQRLYSAKIVHFFSRAFNSAHM